MCGIFAFYSNERSISDVALSRVLESLHQRGPDAQGYSLSPDGRLALAHTRLSINDLRPIQYPLRSRDHAVQLIFNGELYDYEHMKKELIASGHHFTTETDAELALHLYQEKGIHFLSQLRGEFAFILWDERVETLFAVRDRFGVKPLHYATVDGAVHLASDIPTLFQSGVPARWDQERWYEYLHVNLKPDSTLYHGIHQVPPGHYLTVSKQGIKCTQYWDLNYPTMDTPVHDISFQELTAALRSQLLDSVQLRMTADVPVGYYLSGGLDSAALLGMGSHLSSEPQHAFTICFNDDQYSEYTFAEETARHAGAIFHPLHLNEQDMADHFESAASQAMVPMGNAAGVARFLLSQFVKRQGFKAVLSGEGADEVFFGYNFLRIEALEDERYKQTVGNVDDFIKKMNFYFPVDREKLKTMPFGFETIKQAMGYVPRWLQTQTLLNTSHRQMLSEQVSGRFQQYNPYRSLLNGIDVERQILNREPILKSLYLWMKAFFPNHLLSWVGDRMEMAHGIEARQPYLDHRVFELSRQIPTSFKISGTVEKHILREAVKPFVSDAMYKKEKHMFQAPPLDVSRSNPLLDVCLDLIYTYLPHHPFYDKNKLFAFMDGLSALDPADRVKRMDASSTMMSLASVAALQKTYNPGF